MSIVDVAMPLYAGAEDAGGGESHGSAMAAAMAAMATAPARAARAAAGAAAASTGSVGGATCGTPQ